MVLSFYSKRRGGGRGHIHVQACSYGAHLCKVLSYVKPETARASCSESAQSLARGLIYRNLCLQPSLQTAPHPHIILHPKLSSSGSKMAPGRGTCCSTTPGPTRSKVRVTSASRPVPHVNAVVHISHHAHRGTSARTVCPCHTEPEHR